MEKITLIQKIVLICETYKNPYCINSPDGIQSLITFGETCIKMNCDKIMVGTHEMQLYGLEMSVETQDNVIYISLINGDDKQTIVIYDKRG